MRGANDRLKYICSLIDGKISCYKVITDEKITTHGTILDDVDVYFEAKKNSKRRICLLNVNN